MAAPTPVATGALATNTTTVTLPVVSPTCSVGDALICFLLNKQDVNAISAPDGDWTEIAQVDIGTSGRLAAFLRSSPDTGGTTYNFTKATDDNVLFIGVIQAYTPATLDATAAGTQTSGLATDDVTYPGFDPTATENRTIFAAYYLNDLTTFSAAMSADTNPDCTIDFDLETDVGLDASLAVTSGTNDGATIDSRSWASNSTTNAGTGGLVFALVTSAAADTLFAASAM